VTGRSHTEIAELQQSGLQMLPEVEGELRLIPIDDPQLRRVFDRACEEIHYAGACQRVGRCMRLAIMRQSDWAGGIVLGSTFPNILVRDEALDLRRHVEGYRERGLVSPWASENRAYWSHLQRIVNHARTFVFPSHQGEGVGIEAHAVLLDEGLRHWEERYGKAWAFDTLCTSSTSRMFKTNGWTLAGRTAGYTRDSKRALSRRLTDKAERRGRDNAGLALRRDAYKWWVWVRVLPA
jgi:hypothetical protein